MDNGKNHGSKEFNSMINRGNLRDLVIVFSVGLGLLQGVSSWGMAASLVMLLVASGLHFISKGVLVRNKVMCTEGVYGIVRHPYYLSNYLVDMSFCLMSGSILLVGVYPFLFFWAYGPAIRREEEKIFSHHREKFLNAVFHIPQVFPDPDSMAAQPKFLTGFSLRRISNREAARIARFWAVESFFLLLYDLQVEGLRALVSPVDYDGAVFAGAFILLSLVSLMMLRFDGLSGKTR